MNKCSNCVINRFILKNGALLLSLVITLLIFITFLFISGFDHQIQNSEATSNTPTDSPTLSDLIQKGGERLNTSRYEEALVSFDRALMIDSMSVDALNGKGLVLNQLGRYEEAITLFDKVLEINPDFTNALYNKGVTLFNLREYEEAITWFDRSLEINPNFVDAMYNKADALGELGKYEESLVWTDKALTLKPVTHNNSNSNSLLLPND
ncbi:MAG TPA: tetratricopeptide repeat protein [Nitrososphaeraceae archaeon]|nr:tetratricopeptide repeat protein [Nitrososphaeraceae archaeon]